MHALCCDCLVSKKNNTLTPKLFLDYPDIYTPTIFRLLIINSCTHQYHLSLLAIPVTAF